MVEAQTSRTQQPLQGDSAPWDRGCLGRDSAQHMRRGLPRKVWLTANPASLLTGADLSSTPAPLANAQPGTLPVPPGFRPAIGPNAYLKSQPRVALEQGCVCGAQNGRKQVRGATLPKPGIQAPSSHPLLFPTELFPAWVLP